MKVIKVFGLRNYTTNNKVLLPINPNQIKTIAVDFSYDTIEKNVRNWQFVFGSRISHINNTFSCIIRYDKLWINIGNTDKTTDINISIGKHHIEYTNDFDKKICSINLDNKYTTNETITGYSNNNICLYTCNSNDASNQTFLGTIYKINIVKTDNTSINFVPAKYNGKFGFIDESLLETDISSDNFYAETIGGLKAQLDFSKITSIQIPEGNVTKIQDKDGGILWANLDKVAYGIRWSTNTGTTCERIGNLEYHKTLPIQSKFKVCVHQNKDIQYYCNPDDSRFREDPTILSKEQFTITPCDGLPSGVVSCDENSNVKYCCVNDIFADYKYLYAYICVRTESDSCVARIVHIDTTTKTAYLNDYNQQNSIYVDNTCDISNIVNTDADYTVELGTVINGYDGEIGVDTGAKFYQWSVDNEGNGNEVWISEYKCVPYAKEVKRHIVGHNRACVLRTAFNDTKWGWIGTLQSNTAVNVINYNSRLRGGNNPSNFDLYLGVDNFRTQLGKACTNQPLISMRQFTQKLPNHLVLYKLIWEALVWCWCIEYAELDVKKAFNANLTLDGYHQGGLGNGMISINDYGNYCNTCNLTPSDYTLHLGNNTGIVNRSARTFTIPVAANAYWNRYYLSRVTQTRDSSNKVMTITAIPTAYPNDWNVYAQGTVVCGTVRYTVSGLTDGLTIIFKKTGGNLIVVEDGTYDIDWGTSNSNRLIAFSKSLTECNIVLTIESAPGGNLISNQTALLVPHWRGFNVFFYGDNWINIENFLSKYDSTKKKRIYYWTDDITKFDNNIDNKEHLIEDGGNCQINWIKEFVLGTLGAMIPRSYGDGKKVYHWDNTDTSVHATYAGGSFDCGSLCGLGCLYSGHDVGHALSDFGFFTTTILD